MKETLRNVWMDMATTNEKWTGFIRTHTRTQRFYVKSQPSRLNTNTSNPKTHQVFPQSSMEKKLSSISTQTPAKQQDESFGAALVLCEI